MECLREAGFYYFLSLWAKYLKLRGRQVEMVGWHHRFNGHELGQTPGDGEGQGSLACYSLWGCKELERLNGTEPMECSMNCHYQAVGVMSLKPGDQHQTLEFGK